MLGLHLNMLNKHLLTTTSFCCWRVKLRVHSINTYLNKCLVLLSLLESTSSSCCSVLLAVRKSCQQEQTGS